MKWRLPSIKILAAGGAALLAAWLLSAWLWNRVFAEPETVLADEAVQSVLAEYEGEVIGTELAGKAYTVKLKTEDGLYELQVPREGGGISAIKQLEAYDSRQAGGPGRPHSSGHAAQTPPPTVPAAGSATAPAVTPAAESAASSAPAGTAAGPRPVPGSPSAAAPSAAPGSAQPGAGEPPTTPASQAKPGAASSPEPTPQRSPAALISPAQAAKLAKAQVGGEVEETELEQEGGTRYYLVEIHTADGKEADVQVNAASGKIMSITWHEDDNDDEEGKATPDRNRKGSGHQDSDPQDED